jgi:peroxiredoxin
MRLSPLSLPSPRRIACRLFSRSAPAHAFAVRQPLPSWKADALLPDGSFANLSNAWHAGKWAVLLFYPLDWTFVCPTEIIAFSDRAAEFEKIGVSLAAVSVDSKFSHLAWTQQPRSKGGLGRMAIPLIADLSRDMARDFGVLCDDPADGDCGVVRLGGGRGAMEHSADCGGGLLPHAPLRPPHANPPSAGVPRDLHHRPRRRRALRRHQRPARRPLR